MKKLLLIITFALIIGIFYFSWLPDSTLTSEKYLPIWLLNWSNEYVNMRTAVPFVVIGVVLEARSGLQKPVNNKSWIYNTLWAATIIISAEIGQYFTDKRHTDLYDIMYGIVGTLTGVTFYHLTFQLVKKFKKC
ncbi:hypothetical protein [Flavobacterium sp.]|uniref:hypothetical protein n=1 Tax=Flavobacterium sp. TaxID=239 RepID=UPI003BD375C5